MPYQSNERIVLCTSPKAQFYQRSACDVTDSPPNARENLKHQRRFGLCHQNTVGCAKALFAFAHRILQVIRPGEHRGEAQAAWAKWKRILPTLRPYLQYRSGVGWASAHQFGGAGPTEPLPVHGSSCHVHSCPISRTSRKSTTPLRSRSSANSACSILHHCARRA